MDKRLTPLTLAIAASLLSNPNIFAAGGAYGTHGNIYINSSALSAGMAGLDDPINSNGADGNDSAGISLTNPGSIGASVAGVSGSDAISNNDGKGGGGAGGAGGGSFFGALSIGGAAGAVPGARSATPSSSDGGKGGNISAHHITLNTITVTGAAGGNGGAPVETRSISYNINAFGGGGHGGSGGGSVIGGSSLGGAAGFAYSLENTTADGGHGGNISALHFELSDLNLTGGKGGDGGVGPRSNAVGTSTLSADNYNHGAGGSAGAGGGSVLAGVSMGGAAGHSLTLSTSSDASITAMGGNGGDITGNTVLLTGSRLTGADGGHAGNAASSHVDGNATTVTTLREIGTASGSGAIGGLGGGTVTGGVSQGGGGGLASTDGSGSTNNQSTSASGGSGGVVRNHNLTLNDVVLIGADGGMGGAGARGESIDSGITGSVANGSGSGGLGGNGGGSVIGGISLGGAAGLSNAQYINTATTDEGLANGGHAGDVTGNTLSLNNVQLQGGNGGNGGAAPSASADNSSGTGGNVVSRAYGSGGNGGLGGGSVFGGVSMGAAAGSALVLLETPYARANGGDGGQASGNTLELTQVELTGGNGGNGGNGGDAYAATNATGSIQELLAQGAAGGGGGAGGSIFGGFSSGGSGGSADASNASSQARGGAGGHASNNNLILLDVILRAGVAGTGGASAVTRAPSATSAVSAAGVDGVMGGSIIGGYSQGGAGGFALGLTTAQADGGNAGNTSNNQIRLAGISSLPGSIYGGYSQGGIAGINRLGTAAATSALTGQGGLAENNQVTLVGTNLTIGGSVYGGFSIDGDVDFATLGYSSLNNAKTFTGNTLNLEGYRGSVEGVYNFENYNWTLPADVVNRDVLIDIRGNDLVDLNNTKHTVAMLSDGNRLNENDEIVLISKAQGAHQPTSTQVQQGYFIIYDALLDINAADEFVLTIAGKEDTTPVVPPVNPPVTPISDGLPIPAGRLNPVAKSFLEGRVAALAMVNQGADMIAEQLTECTTDVFAIADGGSSRYNTGSSVKVTDRRMAIGGRKCFELPDTSQIMLGVFAEHGTGNYHSRNHFAGVGKVRGHGDLRYTGGGAMLHMDFAGTGSGINPVPVLASKDGVYVDAVVRAGNIKADFASNQILDANNKRAEYKSKSHYASAMLGAGYAWNLDEHEQVELYARYTWDRLASDKVNVGGDELRFGTDHSSRLRVGTRYHYAVTPAIAPYAGLAYEHEFDGKASGKVFDFNIDQPELKGSSGMLEVGVRTLPFGDDSGWHLDAGVQGYFGTRKGATGSLSVNYAF